MFDVPLDAWYVWVGLAVVSATVFGVSSSMPAAAPPDATGLAETVDGVAASRYAAVAEHPVPNAESVRFGTDTVSLRGSGGTTHARFTYGPVTPVGGSERLKSVLDGTPPESVFDSRDTFQRTITASHESEVSWREVDRVTVRRVTWEGTDAVLVG